MKLFSKYSNYFYVTTISQRYRQTDMNSGRIIFTGVTDLVYQVSL